MECGVWRVAGEWESGEWRVVSGVSSSVKLSVE
jgi:hypothetical protein